MQGVRVPLKEQKRRGEDREQSDEQGQKNIGRGDSIDADGKRRKRDTPEGQ